MQTPSEFGAQEDADAARARELLRVSVVLLAGFLLRLHGALDDFGFGWQHLGAHYGLIARNFLEHGFLETRFAQVINVEIVPREQWVFYTHHPPAIALSAALSMQCFGETAFAVRLPTLLFSVAQILAMFLLVREVASFRAAFVAALVTAFLPCGAYYGILVCDLGSPVMCMAVVALWADLRERRSPRPVRWRVACATAIATGALFDWPALLVGLFLGVRDLWRRHVRRAVSFIGLVALLPAVHFFHVRWATGGAGRGASLFDSFLQHGLVGFAGMLEHFTFPQLLEKLAQHWITLCLWWSLPLLLAGVVLVTVDLVRGRRAKASCLAIRESGKDDGTNRVRAELLIGLSILGLGYTVPFARAVVVHEFWMLVFFPLVALATGLVFERAATTRVRTLVCAIALSAGLFQGAGNSWARMEADRTPYFKELGTRILENTIPGVPFFSNERESECLLFYARRQIRGSFHDQDPRTHSFLAASAANAVPAQGYFCLVDPPLDAQSAPYHVLREFLIKHFDQTRFALPESGASLLLFDFSKPAPR